MKKLSSFEADQIKGGGDPSPHPDIIWDYADLIDFGIIDFGTVIDFGNFYGDPNPQPN